MGLSMGLWLAALLVAVAAGSRLPARRSVYIDSAFEDLTCDLDGAVLTNPAPSEQRLVRVVAGSWWLAPSAHTLAVPAEGKPCRPDSSPRSPSQPLSQRCGLVARKPVASSH